jgi:hypothetical protein
LNKLQLAHSELKAVKDKLKQENSKLHDLEKKVHFEYMIRYLQTQKKIITLEREKQTIRQFITTLRKKNDK